MCYKIKVRLKNMDRYLTKKYEVGRRVKIISSL